MAILCQLADPQHYRAFSWSLTADPRDFEYWTGLFEDFPRLLERHLQEDGLAGDDFEARWAAFQHEYLAEIDAYRRDCHADGPVTTLTLVYMRQRLLRKYGWPDPYVKVKERENDAAARMYPDVVRQADSEPAASRYELLLRGVFAGNMFDLGAPATIELYHNGGVDYHAVFARVPDRPWYIDQADDFLRHLLARRYRQTLVFVDNAGTDIALGVLPLVREMARSGVKVVLAANAEPALNDITICELNPLLERLAGTDPVLARLRETGQLSTVSSGNDTPLIDLGKVTPECNAAAAQSDLIILEGMGRGVESNWSQAFRCDALRIALIKDESVARWIGSKLFDAVCRFEPGTRKSSD